MKIKDKDAIMLGIQARLSPAFLDPLTVDEDVCWYPEIEEKLSNFLELPQDYDTTQLFMEANRFLECFIEVVLKAETELFLRSYEAHYVVRNRVYAVQKEYIEPLREKFRIFEEIESEFNRINKSYATERIRIELVKYCDKNIESFNKVCPAAAKAIQEKRYRDISACFNDYNITTVQALCDALCEVKEDVLKLRELYCPKLKNRHSTSKMLPGSWLELKIQQIQERLQFSPAKSLEDRELIQFETLLFIAYAIAKHIHFRDSVFINSFSTTTNFLVKFFKGGIPNKDAIMNAQDNLEEASNKILGTLVNVERDLYGLSLELRFVPRYADLPEDISGSIQKMRDTLFEKMKTETDRGIAANAKGFEKAGVIFSDLTKKAAMTEEESLNEIARQFSYTDNVTTNIMMQAIASLNAGKSYKTVAEELNQGGYKISKSALNRMIQAHEKNIGTKVVIKGTRKDFAYSQKPNVGTKRKTKNR